MAEERWGAGETAAGKFKLFGRGRDGQGVCKMQVRVIGKWRRTEDELLGRREHV